ncbi:5-formyltetrahydrofolate cyclo-ligase [uncultured Sphaerochaeta sp.]|uniref:5-formyltetrahydrofolate cyclo-ligase n=1 Tax=uncultured Sphaerochaeta sp. TaxID=886478 RepID=UPI0029C9D544|nr:5-formyltetrahydrofolate cyclo-ligase [uncultured Sphaerochaeta sp.]
MQDKVILREQLLSQEKTLRGTDFTREDRLSCSALLASTLYKESSWIFGFFPLPSEVDIRVVLHDAIAHKHLALPLCRPDGTMSFQEVMSLDQLHTGSLGISEPEEGNVVIPSIDTLILVPGVAFTHQRERLGRGKAYYDRFLQAYRDAFTLGICRKHQLLTSIPTDQWDIEVDGLLCGGTFY